MPASFRVCLITLLAIAPGLAVFAGEDADPAPATIAFKGEAFGTSYTIKVASPAPDASSTDLQSRIDALLAEIDAQMSLWREDSELSRFNEHRGTDWFDVSAPTARIVSASIELSAATQGAFDPTVSPLVALWNFGPHRHPLRLPSDDEIEQARRHVGISLIEARLSPPEIRKHDPEVRLDLNAIAKGDAVDRVAALIDAVSPRGYMVEIGGEVRTKGTKADGFQWTIGIERPMVGRRVVQSAIKLQDAALATSGDYRNVVEVEGQRFSHTIDPRTGRPVDHGSASVSVVADDCMTADAWATALMVLGPEEGSQIAKAHGVKAMFLSRDGDGFTARSTPGFPPAHALADGPKPIDRNRFPWGTFALAAVVFGLAVAGMSVGVIVANRRLRGSCGGLAGLKDEQGNPLCDACTQPAKECREFREQSAFQSDAAPHEDGKVSVHRHRGSSEMS